MEQVMSLSESAQLYEQYVERARHLNQISSACKPIILAALGEDFDRPLPDEGYDVYWRHTYVQKYGNDLLNAEIRIVEDVSPAEWYLFASKDERLTCIHHVLKMRKQTQQKGYKLTMAPDFFTLELKHHSIKSEYEGDHIKELQGFLDSIPPTQ